MTDLGEQRVEPVSARVEPDFWGMIMEGAELLRANGFFVPDDDDIRRRELLDELDGFELTYAMDKLGYA